MASMMIQGPSPDNGYIAHTHSTCLAEIDEKTGYINNIDEIRTLEYPALQDTTYLDHAGTTPYAKSLIEAYTKELTTNLFGNPHSASASSQLSSARINDIRLQILQHFNADPDHFDVIFVANATAAIKLVADAFRDSEGGFWYGYHSDAHTSLIGVRELARRGSRCFEDSAEVERWFFDMKVDNAPPNDQPQLFAYPGQSNMSGDRHPLKWCATLREIGKQKQQQLYSLYDAAALVSTFPLDLSDPNCAPDFTALSFYKIFGFPDLGALIVRKASGDVLRRRRYFAGGTVEMVSAYDSSWYAKKETLHDALEDGTLPFHNIVALEYAFKTHARIYGNIQNISKHTRYLGEILYTKLKQLKHGNGRSVLRVYSRTPSLVTSGATITFNILDSSGSWISNSEVEKLAIVKNIQFRTGGLCNPGGIAHHLDLSAQEMRNNFAAGQRCGRGNDVLNGKPTGAIRVSLGAMSSMTDINRLVNFLEEFYVDHSIPNATQVLSIERKISKFHIESLSVFPIKSCAAFTIPLDLNWEVLPNGLAWDREWCLIHQGTNVALSQKQYPGMALLQPSIDLERRLLTISHPHDGDWKTISISLDELLTTEALMKKCGRYKSQNSVVCGEPVPIHLYTDKDISQFFTNALNVPCTLARYPHTGTPRYANIRKPKSMSSHSQTDTNQTQQLNPNRQNTLIKLSNESPILLVSRSSVNRLNEQIKQHNSGLNKSVNKKLPRTTITPDTFRANIVIAQDDLPETPYLEDSFTALTIRNTCIDVDGRETIAVATLAALGPCQRCQMVCVDQKSGKRGQEPFSTLAKTRRKDGGVWFGVHFGMVEMEKGAGRSFVRVGDEIVASVDDNSGGHDHDDGRNE